MWPSENYKARTQNLSEFGVRAEKIHGPTTSALIGEKCLKVEIPRKRTALES